MDTNETATTSAPTPARQYHSRVLPFSDYLLKKVFGRPTPQSVETIVDWAIDDVIIMNLKDWKEQELEDRIRLIELEAGMNPNYSTWLDHIDTVVQKMISLPAGPTVEEGIASERRVARWATFVRNIASAAKVPGEDTTRAKPYDNIVFRYIAAYNLLLTTLIDLRRNQDGFFRGELGGPHVPLFGTKVKTTPRNLRKETHSIVGDVSDDEPLDKRDINTRMILIRKPRTHFGESPRDSSNKNAAGLSLPFTSVTRKERIPMRYPDKKKNFNTLEDTDGATSATPGSAVGSTQGISSRLSIPRSLTPARRKTKKAVKTRATTPAFDIVREWADKQYGNTTVNLPVELAGAGETSTSLLSESVTNQDGGEEDQETVRRPRKLQQGTRNGKRHQKHDEEIERLSE